MKVLTSEHVVASPAAWTEIPLHLPDEYNHSGARTLAGFPRPMSYRIAKRIVDVVLGSLLLVLVLPMLLAAAVAISLTSRGPVLFKQKRAGLCGRPFTMYKLRTMVQNLKDETVLFGGEGRNGPTFKHKQDPRITPVGWFLRKTSIDELPQLVNVIRGEMSLVGPRPLPLKQVRLNRFEERTRLSVKPGMTGLWQVSGRADLPYDEWMAMDCYYIRHCDLLLDFLILAKTLPAVFTGRGAY